MSEQNKALADPDCRACKGEGSTGFPIGQTTQLFACQCVVRNLAAKRRQARLEINGIADDLQLKGNAYARRQGRRLAELLAVLK